MKNKFSLLQYSFTAAAFINAAAYSQVIYTDIDPDVVLDQPDEQFGIDLDDDGLYDFNFFNKSFTTTVFYMDLASVKALFVGAFDNMQNGIAGSTGFLSGGGGYTYYWPFIINYGEVVNNSLTFYNDNYQTLAMEIHEFSWPLSVSHQGNWYYFYGVEVLNHYLGFRFTDEESIQRYGWIRCSVIDSGHTLIIHDYAYELQPDYPILAGDTVSYVSINEHINTLDANLYSFNKNIYVHVNENTSAQLIISDITGKEIIKKELVNNYTIIDMSIFSTGIYLVNLMQQEKAYSKKIMIN